MKVTFGRLGDAAVTLHATGAHALHADLEANPVDGMTESVPALDSVTVLYDPTRVTPDALEGQLRARLVRLTSAFTAAGRVVEVPIVYDGPDVENVARLACLSVRDVTDLHASVTYDVAFLGFLPGFAYLAGLPDALRLPRRATPRARVPAGSVAIGGPWSGVYPLDSPGGWHLLGRTPLRFFDPHANPPVLLRPGDRVRFTRVENA